MSEVSWIYVTTSSTEEANRIADALVAARLVACANVIDGMRSVYWWDGAVRRDDETVLVLKTRAALVDAVTEKITSIHSYECPCVLALPVVGGHPPFLQWVADETAGARP